MSRLLRRLLSLTTFLTLSLGVGLTLATPQEGVGAKAATSVGTTWQRVTFVNEIVSGDKYVIMGGSASKNVMAVTRSVGTAQDNFVLPNATTASNLGTNTIDDQNLGWVLTGANGVFTINSV